MASPIDFYIEDQPRAGEDYLGACKNDFPNLCWKKAPEPKVIKQVTIERPVIEKNVYEASKIPTQAFLGGFALLLIISLCFGYFGGRIAIWLSNHREINGA